MIINSTFITLILLFIGLYYLSLFLISFGYKNKFDDEIESKYFFFILIPAKNEEKVIKNTIENFLKFKNRNFRLIIINDNSNDLTRDIVLSFLKRDERVMLFDKIIKKRKGGKGEVLNFGFEQIMNLIRNNFLEPLNLNSDFLKKYDFDHIIISIYDADSTPDANTISKISKYFNFLKVDALQTLVRISNREQNLLAKMQDIEFIGFSRVIQKGRSVIGSVGLGGNGQFVKLSSLLKLGINPWGDTLTEDLEMGLKLISLGMKIGYCDDIITEQEGVLNLKSLIIQRSRWLQGHLTNWKYIYKILKSKSNFITKLDSIFYLTFVSSIVLITLSWLFSILSFVKFLFIKNYIIEYFSNIHNLLGIVVIIIFSFTFLPIFFYGVKDFYKKNLLSKIFNILIFAFYTYIWIPSFFVGLYKLILGNEYWIKTERYAVQLSFENINIENFNERRFYKRLPFFSFNIIENKPVFLLDYSEGGLGFLINKSFNIEKIINIDIKELNLNRKGEIVYKMPINNSLLRVGVKFI